MLRKVGTPRTALNGTRVTKESLNVTPANGAVDISPLPELVGEVYYSLYSVPQKRRLFYIYDRSVLVYEGESLPVGGVPATSHVLITGLPLASTLKWQYRDETIEDEFSELSALTGFTVIATPIATPSGISPPEGATDVSGSVTLTGSPYSHVNDLPMAAGQWQVSTDETFATTVIDTGDVAGTAVSYEASGLLVSTTYYWRLRYKDSEGSYSLYSAPVEFSTSSSFYPGNEVAKLMASDAQVSDRFGYSVSVSGDTAVIGAYREATGGSYAGAAYVFTRSGGAWVEQAKLMASDAQESDRFGYSVSVSGDTAVIGAYREATGGSSAGAAYVFE